MGRCKKVESHYQAVPQGTSCLDKILWVYHIGEDDILTGPDFGCIHWEAKDNG